MAAYELYGDYNPANFDWDDGEGIDLDGIGNPNIMEDIMAAALANHDEHFDWTYVKRSELRERAGRMYISQIIITDEDDQKWFEKEWPEYVFVWDKATRHHDHPVSHLCNELNEIEMTAHLVREGIPYIDLFGNGRRDAKYKRKALTLYDLKSAKDYLRYFGMEDDVYTRKIDWAKLWSGGYRWGSEEIQELCLSHALYYVSLDEVARWCNMGPRKRVRAMVHRHDKSYGSLNRGEQEYSVSEDGVVSQQNVQTGEPYTHPSMEALFHQFSAKTQYGGVAWTVTKMGGDTYQFEFVSCKEEFCGTYVPLKFLKPETRSEWSFNDTTVRSFLGWTWMSVKRGAIHYKLVDADLTDKLRRYVAGKPRNARMKSELTNYARRLTNKADIIAIHGGGAHEILVGRMSDYVENAFYMDAQHELEVALSYWRKNATIINAINVYYEKGTMPTDMVSIKKALSVAGKATVSAINVPTVLAIGAAISTGGAMAPVAIAAASGGLTLTAAAGYHTWQEFKDQPPPW